MQSIANNGYIHNHTFKSLLLQGTEEAKGKGFVGFFNIPPPRILEFLILFCALRRLRRLFC